MSIGVLVTRPQTLADSLILALEKEKIKTWHLPTMAIENLTDTESVQSGISDIAAYPWHIFVSRHAVAAVLPQMCKTWSMLTLNQLHFAAVGDSTAKALTHFLASDILYPQNGLGSEALWAVLKDKVTSPVMLWCGNRATPFLKNVLTENGISVREVVCYQRKKISLENDNIKQALEKNQIQYVLIHSGESVEHLSEIKDLLQATTLIVVSDRIKMIARNLGFNNRIIIAQGADDAAMIHALRGSHA